MQIVHNELLWLSSSIFLIPERRLLLHISPFSFFLSTTIFVPKQQQQKPSGLRKHNHWLGAPEKENEIRGH